MAEFEKNKIKSDEWYTPPEIFKALKLKFDLDPCSPGHGKCHVPAKYIYTKDDDGLLLPWFGLVFVNPPFGKRQSHIPWLVRFLSHGNGIAIFRAYTSAAWFHKYIPQADAILFPKGKTKFIRPDRSIGNHPGHGVVLISCGDIATDALRHSKLGIFIRCEQWKEKEE